MTVTHGEPDRSRDAPVDLRHHRVRVLDIRQKVGSRTVRHLAYVLGAIDGPSIPVQRHIPRSLVDREIEARIRRSVR
jgi:hypothetical protein